MNHGTKQMPHREGGTRTNDSQRVYKCVTAHIEMSHGTHINEPRHLGNRGRIVKVEQLAIALSQ